MTDGEALRLAVFDAPSGRRPAPRLRRLAPGARRRRRARPGGVHPCADADGARPTRELMDEYGRLMAAHEACWLRHLPEALRHRRTVDFRGGFVRGVALSVAELLAHGPDIVRHYPIDSLGLTNLPVLKDAKNSSPWRLRWDRLRHPGRLRPAPLRVGRPETAVRRPADEPGPTPDHQRRALCQDGADADRLPGLAGLRSLSFMNTKFDGEAAALLFGRPDLAGVAELSFYAAGLRDDAAQALLRSPFAGGAGTVSLQYNHFTEPIRASSASGSARRLPASDGPCPRPHRPYNRPFQP